MPPVDSKPIWAQPVVIASAAIAASALAWLYFRNANRPPPVIGELWVYPVKSCRGIRVKEAVVTPYGLQYDREWFVVGPENKPRTLSNFPRLGVVAVRFDGDDLVLSAEGKGEVRVPLNDKGSDKAFDYVHLAVNGGAVEVCPKAGEWLTQVTGSPCRLCRVVRPRDPREYTADAPVVSTEGARVMSHDWATFMIMGRKTGEQVRDACPDPAADGRRMRANVVLDNTRAREEDSFRDLRIGATTFRYAKWCTRCSVPTVQPDGTNHKTFEPTTTLKKKFSAVEPHLPAEGAKAICGVYYFHESTVHTTLREGDVVQVLGRGAAPKYTAAS